MVSLFYQDADAALVCFDMTNDKTFEQVINWLDDLKQNTNNPNIVIALVGTKLDLAN
jgi:GTPase SAR1 family protein